MELPSIVTVVVVDPLEQDGLRAADGRRRKHHGKFHVKQPVNANCPFHVKRGSLRRQPWASPAIRSGRWTPLSWTRVLDPDLNVRRRNWTRSMGSEKEGRKSLG